MATTEFTNNVTLTDADWFNDLDRLHYDILGDPADAAAVRTAISALGAATQSEQEAGSSTTVGVTPGRQQYHPSAAKWWCSANDSGTIGASYNTTSVTDGGTGDITFTIATDFSSGSWSPYYSPLYNSFTGSYRIQSIAPGSMQVIVFNLSGAATDPSNHSGGGFGDQA
jgi:hypothetical protein